jgi:hypothetical protein
LLYNFLVGQFSNIIAIAYQLISWIASDWPADELMCHLLYETPTKRRTSYRRIKSLFNRNLQARHGYLISITIKRTCTTYRPWTKDIFYFSHKNIKTHKNHRSFVYQS